MNTIFEIATNIAKPLSLAGFFAAALFYLFKKIISKAFLTKTNQKQSFFIVNKILNYLFILSLIALILGVIAYLTDSIISKNNNPTNWTQLQSKAELEIKLFNLEQEYSDLQTTIRRKHQSYNAKRDVINRLIDERKRYRENGDAKEVARISAQISQISEMQQAGKVTKSEENRLKELENSIHLIKKALENR